MQLGSYSPSLSVTQVEQFEANRTWLLTVCWCIYNLLSLASQTAPTAAFSSFRINMRREGLGVCICCFGSQKCKMYVTSRVGSTHMMSRAGQLMLYLLFEWAKNLLFDRSSLRKVSRATKLKKRSRSGGSRVQTCDDTHILQSNWPAKIWAHRSKMVL
jgi:hypothetical protein